MSHSEEEDDEEGCRFSRWKELQAGPLTCEKCKQKATEQDQVVTCGMAPSHVLDDDDEHPAGCLKLLCRGCATASPPLPFQPCACFALVDHEPLFIWCPECTKNFKKCNSCSAVLCSCCEVEDAKRCGLPCHHCLWAMVELLGGNPEGVTCSCAPWYGYKTPENIQKAAQKLHDEVKANLPTSSDDDAASDDDEGDKKPAAVDAESVQQSVFVLVHSEGGPYCDTNTNVVGVYSTKKLAVQGAKIRFEELSGGCYEDGRFREPGIFEEVVDNTTDLRDDDDDVGALTLFYQLDQEGAYSQLVLQKSPFDEILVSKTTEKVGRKKRFRRW